MKDLLSLRETLHLMEVQRPKFMAHIPHFSESGVEHMVRVLELFGRAGCDSIPLSPKLLHRAFPFAYGCDDTQIGTLQEIMRRFNFVLPPSKEAKQRIPSKTSSKASAQTEEEEEKISAEEARQFREFLQTAEDPLLCEVTRIRPRSEVSEASVPNRPGGGDVRSGRWFDVEFSQNGRTHNFPLLGGSGPLNPNLSWFRDPAAGSRANPGIVETEQFRSTQSFIHLSLSPYPCLLLSWNSKSLNFHFGCHERW